MASGEKKQFHDSGEQIPGSRNYQVDRTYRYISSRNSTPERLFQNQQQRQRLYPALDLSPPSYQEVCGNGAGGGCCAQTSYRDGWHGNTEEKKKVEKENEKQESIKQKLNQLGQGRTISQVLRSAQVQVKGEKSKYGMEDIEADDEAEDDDDDEKDFELLQDAGKKIYGPKKVLTREDEANMFRKVEIGKRRPGVTEKVIMIIGASGSGKTTLINGMYNYIVGVEWKDEHRLKLIHESIEANQAKSQTQWITAYTIHNNTEYTVPYSLTIIDTPGFGDTSGIKRDQEITNQIRNCFKSKGLAGIDSLDAVGFVANSSQPRLNAPQKYIFESVLSIFGKDIADNIFMLLTFADGKKPQVLSGIKEASIPYKKFFKFNNSALYEDSENVEEDEDDNFDEMFWKMGEKSFKVFMTELGKVQPQSLSLTKTVLEERNRLENTIEGIQKNVKMGLNKLDQLRIEHRILDHYQADIDKSKHFTYFVNEEKVETRQTNPNQYTTNCIICNRTCHENCIYNNDDDKAKCIAMCNGVCTVCDPQCPWDMHKNQPYICVPIVYPVKKTAEDLKKRYEEAAGKKLSAEQLVKSCQEDFDQVQLKVLSLVDQARKSIDRLNEIALRTNPLSTVDYIEILISSETTEGKTGWQERVQQLEEVKEKAEQIEKLAEENYDPFIVLKEQYKSEMDQRRRERREQEKVETLKHQKQEQDRQEELQVKQKQQAELLQKQKNLELEYQKKQREQLQQQRRNHQMTLQQQQRQIQDQQQQLQSFIDKKNKKKSFKLFKKK